VGSGSRIVGGVSVGLGAIEGRDDRDTFRLCRSTRRTRSAVYRTNKIGPSTDPCGTPRIRLILDYLVKPRLT
jgi:hypothetical protein